MLDHLNVPVEVVSELAQPIALNFLGSHGDGGSPAKRYVALCDVRLRYNGYELVAPKGYEFDGPSIPRALWWIVGLSPADLDTIFASLFHDLICDTRVLARVVGDAIFCVALGPIVLNGNVLSGVGPKRRAAMYLAVRGWSIASGADPLLRAGSGP